MLSPSQSLNLKVLKRTLDKTKVSSIQGVVGGGTLVFFSPPACGTRGAVRGGSGPWRKARRAAAAAHARARRSAATAWDPSPATAWVLSASTAWGASAATAWVPSLATSWDA
jgi:hypothetical protein